MQSADKMNLKSVFKLCKENLQRRKKDSEISSDQAGVMKGTKIGNDTWQEDGTDREIPLEFLTSVGIFEVPPSDCGELTLTAQHLSYIEYAAASAIILSSDIKTELEKIQNSERFKAVAVYIRKYFVSTQIK